MTGRPGCRGSQAIPALSGRRSMASPRSAHRFSRATGTRLTNHRPLQQLDEDASRLTPNRSISNHVLLSCGKTTNGPSGLPWLHAYLARHRLGLHARSRPLRRLDSNQRPRAYETREIPLLHVTKKRAPGVVGDTGAQLVAIARLPFGFMSPTDGGEYARGFWLRMRFDEI